ncbi:DUF4865 family protein [Vibrio gazogenes]|uniref:DUF4865 domain-containing protein n=1 Tax=Vibrio gazogenes TaxID=687 RepID=A0A1Z2SH42_VIBGA|nr:DUF4865 family protein [Vibrio gazogenes]ASA56491.1 DUF4865 domain-containing protein [Vibrio gazogenes]
MIAMQYKFVLPADYDMTRIERRITEKGYLLDDWPGLVFKAYLYARQDAPLYHSPVNSYAPFYVWQDHHAMMAFLNSEGFKALCEQFGRPKVETWFIDEPPTPPTAQHQFASITHDASQQADVQGINYHAWQPIRVTWIRHAELSAYQAHDLYAVGYIARGQAFTAS